MIRHNNMKNKLYLFLIIMPFLPKFSYSSTELPSLIISIEEYANKNIPKTFELITQANLELGKKPNEKYQARISNLTAYTYMLSGNFNLSLKYIRLARQQSTIIDNQYELAESKRLEAVLYTLSNLQNESLPLFLEALKIHKKLHSKKIFHTLQGISLYYYNTNNFDKYLEYGYLLLKDPITLSNKQLKGAAEYTIGQGLLKLGKLKQSKTYLSASITTLNSIQSILVTQAYMTLAELEFMQGKPYIALNTLISNQDIANKNQYTVADLQSELLKAKIYISLKKNQKAKVILSALLATSKNDLSNQQQAHKKLAEIFEEENNYQQANIHLKEHKKLSDLLFKKNQETKSAFYQTRLDFENKELQITQLESEKKLNALQQAQNIKTAKLRDAILALFICIIALLIFYTIRIKRAKNKMKILAEEANYANQAKSSFLAKMSHEISNITQRHFRFFQN